MTSRQKCVAAFVVTAALGASGLMLSAQAPQAVGTWAPAGALTESQSGGAVVLEDGRTLIVGGSGADGAPTDRVLIVNPWDNSLITAGRLLAARVGHTATLLADGRVLVTGGTVDGTLVADLELFNVETGASELVGTLGQARTGHSAARLADGTVLIVGGVTPDGAVVAAAESFDPATNSTTPLASGLQSPRAGASATRLIDGRVLVVGGHNGTTDLSSAEIYHPATQTFSLLDTGLSVARNGHAAVLLPNNNSVLIAGGRSNGVPQTAADLFLPAEFPDPYSYGTGTFAATAAMSAARTGAVSGPGHAEGLAFVAGGGSQSQEQYRFATIRTDKDDYAPGERAVISGTGWQPGEDVTLVFQEDPAVHDDYVLTVTADAAGDIYWDQWAPEWHDLGVRFYLMAHDSRSRAQTTFTDALTVRVKTNGVESGVTLIAWARFNTTNCSGTSEASNTVAADDHGFVEIPGTIDLTHSIRLTAPANSNGRSFSSWNAGEATSPSVCVSGGNSNGKPPWTAHYAAATPPSLSVLSVQAASGTFGGTVTLAATLSSGATGLSTKTISFSLNGSSVGTATTNAGGVASIDVQLTSSGTVAGTLIGAGTYSAGPSSGVGVSFVGDASYAAASGTANLTVGKATPSVAATGGPFEYTGGPHGGSCEATGVGGAPLGPLTPTYTPGSGVPVNAGTYTVNCSYVASANYTSASASADLTIDKATPTVEATGGAFDYTGTAHNGTCAVTGVGGADIGPLAASYTPGPDAPTHAGSYTVNCSVRDEHQLRGSE